MNKHEQAVVIGLVRSGAEIEDIVKIFWYIDYEEIEKVMNKYSIKKK